MLFLPIDTDAPLYHFPWGTIGLIAANVVCFIGTGMAMDAERLEPWILEYGNGLNPLEWLTFMFAHGGWMHLIGNMFFLWGFGLIVEGKLGWRRFLPLYLSIGLLHGCLVDLMTLHHTDSYVVRNVLNIDDIQELRNKALEATDGDAEQVDALISAMIALARGGCLGASGVIFGLVAISLIWAPRNEMHLVGLFLHFPVSFDVPILWYALTYLVWDLAGTIWQQGAMVTASLHTIGGGIGIAVGILYLRRDWVDCENWDLFAVLRGTNGRRADEGWVLGAHAIVDKSYLRVATPQDPEPDGAAPKGSGDSQPGSSGVRNAGGRSSRVLQSIHARVDAGDFLAASEELFQLRLADSRSQLDQARLKRLALGLLQADVPDEAELYLDEYIQRFPDDVGWARIRMARQLLERHGRPAAALAMLKSLKSTQVNEQQLLMARRIAAAAKQQIRSGVQDAEPEW